MTQLLVQELGEALLTSSLVLPGETEAMTDPYEIRSRLERELDLIIDAGIIEHEMTTMIEFSDRGAEIIRQGKGLAHMLT